MERKYIKNKGNGAKEGREGMPPVGKVEIGAGF